MPARKQQRDHRKTCSKDDAKPSFSTRHPRKQQGDHRKTCSKDVAQPLKPITFHHVCAKSTRISPQSVLNTRCKSSLFDTTSLKATQRSSPTVLKRRWKTIILYHHCFAGSVKQFLSNALQRSCPKRIHKVQTCQKRRNCAISPFRVSPGGLRGTGYPVNLLRRPSPSGRAIRRIPCCSGRSA